MMTQKSPALGALALAFSAFLFSPGLATADDLTTRSGTTYRDVHPMRVEPDGITWQHAGGVVKVDFADTPENVRQAYHYDAAKAAAFRAEQRRAQAQADENARHDAELRAALERQRMQVALAQASSDSSTDSSQVFRRARSAAASESTRETANRMREEQDRRAAEEAARREGYRLIPPLPSIFGPRPVNPFMDTANAREFVAAMHTSPTRASGNFSPDTFDPNRTTTLDTPIYLTRSYYDEVDRAEAYARGGQDSSAKHD